MFVNLIRQVRFVLPLVLILSGGCASNKEITHSSTVTSSSSSSLRVGGPGVVSRSLKGHGLSRVHRVHVLPLHFASPEFQASLGEAFNSRLIGLLSKSTELEFVQVTSTKDGATDNVDASLVVEISRFRERDGGRLGASSPAEISISMTLADGPSKSKDRIVLWSGDFSYKQEPIGSNILKAGSAVGAGFSIGWSTVDELFERGVTLLLQDLVEQRRAQFLAQPARGSSGQSSNID